MTGVTKRKKIQILLAVIKAGSENDNKTPELDSQNRRMTCYFDYVTEATAVMASKLRVI